MAAILIRDLPAVIVYINDNVMKSQSWEGRIEKGRIVLGVLREAGMKVQVKKCELERAETAMRGQIVRDETMRTDPYKTGFIINPNLSSTKTELQSLLGIKSYSCWLCREIAHGLAHFHQLADYQVESR